MVRDDGGSAPDAGFLRFGLAAIKGLGPKAVENIVDARRQGSPFRDIFDFCERVDLSTVNRGVTEALIKAGSFDTTGAVRKGLIAAVDKALLAGAEVQRDRDAGQMNMFGDLPGSADGAGAHPAISPDEWTEAEMLAHEKSVLGFYVTKHPLAGETDLIDRFSTAACAELRDINDATDVILGGMISRVRMQTIKTGRSAGSRMAVLTFEDLTGSVEAVVFSDELERHRDLVAPDRLAFLVGRVDRRRQDPSLRVSEIIAFADAPARLAEAAVVRLSAIGLERSMLERLRDVCRDHAGECLLLLRIQTSAGLLATISAGDALRVRPDDAFVQAVEALLGPGVVEVRGTRRPSNGGRAAPPASGSARGATGARKSAKSSGQPVTA